MNYRIYEVMETPRGLCYIESRACDVHTHNKIVTCIDDVYDAVVNVKSIRLILNETTN